MESQREVGGLDLQSIYPTLGVQDRTAGLTLQSGTGGLDVLHPVTSILAQTAVDGPGVDPLVGEEGTVHIDLRNAEGVHLLVEVRLYLQEGESHPAETPSTNRVIGIDEHRILLNPLGVEGLQPSDGQIHLSVDVCLGEPDTVPSPPEGMVGEEVLVQLYLVTGSGWVGPAVGIDLVDLLDLVLVRLISDEAVEDMPRGDDPSMIVDDHERCTVCHNLAVLLTNGDHQRTGELGSLLACLGEHVPPIPAVIYNPSQDIHEDPTS